MLPRTLDPASGEGGDHIGRSPRRPVGEDGLSRRDLLEVSQPVLAARDVSEPAYETLS
jgi:hypothetical protein